MLDALDIPTGAEFIPWELQPPEQRARARAQLDAKLDDVGRNDPCPCGSGRKFKKCCA